MSLVTTIVEVSDQIKNGRKPLQILAHLMSEIGELAEEVVIEQGLSHKPPGVDGVIGEGVDSILCIIDLIHTMYPEVTEEYLVDVAVGKLNKWKKYKNPK